MASEDEADTTFAAPALVAEALVNLAEAERNYEIWRGAQPLPERWNPINWPHDQDSWMESLGALRAAVVKARRKVAKAARG